MKKQKSTAALPRYSNPHSQSDKYRAIVQCMAHYTNVLLDMSRRGDMCDADVADHEVSSLLALEDDLTELSGDDGSQGYLTETLEHLKAALLGNSHERYQPANSTLSSGLGFSDAKESRFPSSISMRAESGQGHRTASSSAISLQPSTMCLFRQYDGIGSEQCVDEEDSAGSECSSAFKKRTSCPLETYPSVSETCTKTAGMVALSEDDIASEGEVSESDPSGTADSSSCDGEAGGGEGAPAPSKKSKRLNKSATEFLTRWLLDHQDDPFPSPEEKAAIARHLNLSPRQVGNWMTNMRKRHLYPVIAGKRPPKTPLDFAVLERHHQHFTASTFNGRIHHGHVPSYKECVSIPNKKGSAGDMDECDGDGGGDCDESSSMMQMRAQGWRHLPSLKREGGPLKTDLEELGSKKPRLSGHAPDFFDDCPERHEDGGPFLFERDEGICEDSSASLTSCMLGRDLGDMNAFERDLWSSVASDGCSFSIPEEFPSLNATCMQGESDDLGWFDLIGLSGSADTAGALPVQQWEHRKCADAVAAMSEI